MIEQINNAFFPQSSDNEELSMLSSNKLLPLFDVQRFIIDKPTIDNGIDFSGEIKKEKSKIGFSFHIQLKSKGEAIKNKDGSYSKSLVTSNIEYLLSKGLISIYCFYVNNEDVIYYEYLHAIIKSLQINNSKWETQKNHSIRFNKILDASAINGLYNVVFERGCLMRELNYKLAVKDLILEIGDNILIDYNNNLTDDNEIRSTIEKLGFAYINSGKWDELIKLSDKASSGLNKTALYNLLLGISNYYAGEIYKSLDYFKQAILLSNNLPDILIDHLKYYNVTIKYSLNIINKNEYEEQIKQIEDINLITFAQIQLLKNSYINSMITIDDLRKQLDSIINNKDLNTNVRFVAESELLFCNGSEMNMHFFKEICELFHEESVDGINGTKRNLFLKKKSEIFDSWINDCKEINNKSFNNRNYFVYYSVPLIEIKIRYERRVYERTIEKLDSSIKLVNDINDLDYFNNLLISLNKIEDFFRKINFIENVFTTLFTKYEILHFISQKKQLDEVKKELDVLNQRYGSDILLKKYTFLINKGTTHEQVKIMIQNIFN